MIVKIPVTWEVCGIAEIEANSIEEAIQKVEATKYDMDPPHHSEYVDGSLSLSYTDAETIAEFQN